MKNSKYLYLIDYGHGGLIDGIYQTGGKRSPKFTDRFFPDGTPYVFYEGVNNRDNGNRLMKALKCLNIDYIDLVNTNEDMRLLTRVSRANNLNTKRPCIYISIHTNAHGNGSEFTTAKGNSVHISTNASSKSHKFAELLEEEFKTEYKDLTRWRGVKENDFYVLKKTNCPAVLLETGFMTNKEETLLMLSEDWKDRFVNSVINAIQLFEIDN